MHSKSAIPMIKTQNFSNYNCQLGMSRENVIKLLQIIHTEQYSLRIIKINVNNINKDNILTCNLTSNLV